MSGHFSGVGGILALTVLGGGLAGCAVGSNTFSCPGRPEGVRCADITEIYELTNTVDRIEATAEGPIGDDTQRAAEARAEQRRRSAGPGNATTAAAGPTQIAGGGLWQPPRVDRPTPIRTPAQVMRVWMAPWEDTRGVLHVGGYHYVEVEARRWTLGGPVEGESSRVFTINYDDSVIDQTPGPDGAAEAAAGGPSAGVVSGPALTGN